MREQHVFIVDSGTTKYLEIAETGAQRPIRKITLTAEEAIDVLEELREKLHEIGVR